MRSCVPPRRCTMPSPDHAPRIEVNVLCAWAGGAEITVSANAPKPTLRQRDGRSCNIIVPPTGRARPGAITARNPRPDQGGLHYSAIGQGLGTDHRVHVPAILGPCLARLAPQIQGCAVA